MTDPETRSTLVELTRLAAQVAELELRVAAHAETARVGDETGATSMASWWAHTTQQTRVEAHRKTKLAVALAAHEPVRAAMATGQVVAEQARVITEAVEVLPSDLVDPEIIDKAEQTLIDYACLHDAKALRILGRRILEVAAPEVAEAHEARQLEQEETAATAAARFTMSDDGHGTCHGRFTLPTLQGEMLRKALQAIAAPKHQSARDGHAPRIPPHPAADGSGVLRVHRAVPDRPAPEGWGPGRDRGGHHRRRDADRRSGLRGPGHRSRNLARGRQAAGV